MAANNIRRINSVPLMQDTTCMVTKMNEEETVGQERASEHALGRQREGLQHSRNTPVVGSCRSRGKQT